MLHCNFTSNNFIYKNVELYCVMLNYSSEILFTNQCVCTFPFAKYKMQQCIFDEDIYVHGSCLFSLINHGILYLKLKINYFQDRRAQNQELARFRPNLVFTVVLGEKNRKISVYQTSHAKFSLKSLKVDIQIHNILH